MDKPTTKRIWRCAKYYFELCLAKGQSSDTVRGKRGAETVECVATNVFVKGPAGWRLLIHHATPADEGEPPAAAPSGAVLH